MGLFGRKKTETAKEDSAATINIGGMEFSAAGEEEERGPDPEARELTEEELRRLRQAVIRNLDYNTSLLPGAKRLFADIEKLFPAFAMIDAGEDNWAKSNGAKRLEEEDLRSLAEKAEEELSRMDLGMIRADIAGMGKADQLKLFHAFDIWGGSVKPVPPRCMGIVKGMAAEALLKREDLDEGEVMPAWRQENPYITLLTEVNALEKQNAPEEKLVPLRTKLGAMLFLMKEVYVAYDEDFNRSFPYFGTDGKMQVFTGKKLAEGAAEWFAKNGEGHFTIRTIPGKELPKLFLAMQHMGIPGCCLENGFRPVTLKFSEFVRLNEPNLVEEMNAPVRGCFLRELQMAYRLRKLGDGLKDSPRRKAMAETMLTMAANAMQHLGRGLVYVLCSEPYRPGVTLYSARAMERAKALIKERDKDEKALVARGDTSYELVGKPFRMRAVQREDKKFVCAFTDRLGAERLREHFKKSGMDDGVALVTWDDLRDAAKGFSGIILDMASYGREIREQEYASVDNWRGKKGPIRIVLKDGAGGKI